jgi:hypothetical protein
MPKSLSGTALTSRLFTYYIHYSSKFYDYRELYARGRVRTTIQDQCLLIWDFIALIGTHQLHCVHYEIDSRMNPLVPLIPYKQQRKRINFILIDKDRAATLEKCRP